MKTNHKNNEHIEAAVFGFPNLKKRINDMDGAPKDKWLYLYKYIGDYLLEKRKFMKTTVSIITYDTVRGGPFDVEFNTFYLYSELWSHLDMRIGLDFGSSDQAFPLPTFYEKKALLNALDEDVCLFSHSTKFLGELQLKELWLAFYKTGVTHGVPKRPDLACKSKWVSWRDWLTKGDNGFISIPQR